MPYLVHVIQTFPRETLAKFKHTTIIIDDHDEDEDDGGVMVV